MRLLAALATLAIGLSACSGLVTDDVVDGPTAPFGECPPPYAFVGEATLAELGLSRMFGPPDSSRRGTVWITRDTVSPDFGAPPGAPGGGGPEGQALCVEWPDGSGMSTTLTEPWQPPSTDVEPTAGDGVPVGAVGLLIAAAVIVTVSWVAFRREPRAAS
jgi:hypothetical protein